MCEQGNPILLLQSVSGMAGNAGFDGQRHDVTELVSTE